MEGGRESRDEAAVTSEPAAYQHQHAQSSSQSPVAATHSYSPTDEAAAAAGGGEGHQKEGSGKVESHFSSLPSIVSWFHPRYARSGVKLSPEAETAAMVKQEPEEEEEQEEEQDKEGGAAMQRQRHAASEKEGESDQGRRMQGGGLEGTGGFHDLPSVVTWAPAGSSRSRADAGGDNDAEGHGNAAAAAEGAGGNSQFNGSSSVSAMKEFETTRLNLDSEGTKQMAFLNAYVLRSEQDESQLWYAERKNLILAEESLRNAKASYSKLVEYMKEHGKESMVLDDNGRFLKQDAVDTEERRINEQLSDARAREDADRCCARAQEIVLGFGRAPYEWMPWDPPIVGTEVCAKLEEAREMCLRARSGYEQIIRGGGRVENMTRDGVKVGRQVLEWIVFQQLEAEEERARHRLSGDELLVDALNACKGEIDHVMQKEFCQKMFTSTDADGGGAIEAEELKQCLIMMKVYLTDQEVMEIVKGIDTDGNGTIDIDEWENGIVLAKYKVYLQLAMANNYLDCARREYHVAGALDRKNAIFETQRVVDRLTPVSMRERMLGSIWGMMVGDALGVPAEGSVNLRALDRDYGTIRHIMPVSQGPQADGGLELLRFGRLPHLGREPTRYESHYVLEPDRKSDIMGKKEKFYGMPGVHPHRCLGPGSNTLSGNVVRLLVSSLVEKQAYDRDHFLDLYINFMLNNPDKDMHIDALHVEFFERYAGGNKPYYSAGMGKGATEATSLGLVLVTPLIVYLSVQEELRDALIARGEGRYSFYRLQYSARHASPHVVENSMLDMVYQFIELFYRSEKMQMYATQWTVLMKKLMLGNEPRAEIWEAARRIDLELDRLVKLPDDEVIGGCLSSSNLIEHSYPAVLFLAAKYVDDPEGAIVVSANLGGDSSNRTSLVGAVMGAIHGYTEIPLRWRELIRHGKQLDADCQALVLLGMYLKPE